ncbi:hypothetical protein Tco_0500170 [Tanacetum coccineum]
MKKSYSIYRETIGLRCVSSVRGLRSALQANDIGPSYQPPQNPSILDPWIMCTSHPSIGLLGIASVSRLCCQRCQNYSSRNIQACVLERIYPRFFVRCNELFVQTPGHELLQTEDKQSVG